MQNSIKWILHNQPLNETDRKKLNMENKKKQFDPKVNFSSFPSRTLDKCTCGTFVQLEEFDDELYPFIILCSDCVTYVLGKTRAKAMVGWNQTIRKQKVKK